GRRYGKELRRGSRVSVLGTAAREGSTNEGTPDGIDTRRPVPARSALDPPHQLATPIRRRSGPPEDLVAAVLPPLKASYQTWMFFDQLAPAGIRFMEAEISGTKRVPPAEASAAWRSVARRAPIPVAPMPE